MKQLSAVFFVGMIGLSGSGMGAGLDLKSSSDERLPSNEGKADEWRVTVGGGLAYVPIYQGARKQEFRALPLIDVQKGRFFAGVRGLGVNLSPFKHIEFGPRLTYRGGRDEDDASRLRGLGDIDAALEIGAYAQARFAPFTLFANVRSAPSDDNGTLAQIGASHETVFGSRDRVRIGASLEWSDRDYMQTHFGVTPAQSRASGLAAYAPQSGVKGYGLFGTWTHSFSPSWFSAATVNLTRLGDKPTDSPVVERKTQAVSSVVLGYRF